MTARWPVVPEVDSLLLKESEFFSRILHEFRVRLKKLNDKVFITNFYVGHRMSFFEI